MVYWPKPIHPLKLDAGVWLPDTANEWHEVTSFSSKAEFKATGLGFGLTPT